MDSPEMSAPDEPAPPLTPTLASVFAIGAVLAVATVGLVVGWKLFQFRTDDAYIAFRYVSNSRFGWGYTWNPPPFRAVEGYTSLLWVLLLDGVWRFLGVEPPEAADALLLGSSFATLVLTTYMALRFDLGPRLRRWRVLWLALVLLGVLTNRTFLTWTSSGLETAMWNALVTGWVAAALFGGLRSRRSVLLFSTLAALLCFARPDGLLFAATSIGLLLLALLSRWKARTLGIPDVAALAPLLLIPCHIAWRRFTYGEWLPNTYFAKNVGPWPEAGARYIGAFALEYALWVWMLVCLLFLIARGRLLLRAFRAPGRSLVACGVVSTLVLHVAYYTIRIGGDHFEYRIYSHLIPLIFLSFLWMLSRLGAGVRVTASALVAFVLLAVPVPWIHWWRSRALETREEAYFMKVPIADGLPESVRWYGDVFDRLQSWMLDRGIGTRHQEHKIFERAQLARLPSRAEGARVPEDGQPLIFEWVVGVPGWVLPKVAIVDLLGLNDYVIARGPIRPDRAMAHDRRPPPGYKECFTSNVEITPGRDVVVRTAHREESTRIIACEEAWWFLARDPAVALSGPLLFPNSDFEHGNLEGWTATGPAFVTQPTTGNNPSVRGVSAPRFTGVQGRYWIGTYERYRARLAERPGDVQGDEPQGRLVSRPFTIERPWIAFRLGGGCDSSQVGIVLHVEGKETRRATGLCTEALHPGMWHVQDYVGRRAEIMIFDDSSAGWGHVNADDFRYLADPPRQ
jgi:arabinofuranosyltransferase